MDEIIVKEYDDQQRDACIQLLSQTSPGTSDEKTFKWRFEANRGRRPLIICANHNDKVISFNSWIPWEFEYLGQKFTGYQSGESATMVDYRSKGIWSRVLKYADGLAPAYGIDFLFGFPSRMSYGAFLKAGYHEVNRYTFWVRPISPFISRQETSVDYVKEECFDVMLSENEKITPSFETKYCRWRYMDSPLNYDIVEYQESNAIGLFFLRRKKWRGLPEVLLMDFQINCYDKKFIKKALDSLNANLTRNNLYIRTFFNMRCDRGKALMRHFWWKAQSKYCVFCVKPVSERIETKVLLNSNNWDIMPHCVDDI